jgi:hypothetical protein
VDDSGVRLQVSSSLPLHQQSFKTYSKLCGVNKCTKHALAHSTILSSAQICTGARAPVERRPRINVCTVGQAHVTERALGNGEILAGLGVIFVPAMCFGLPRASTSQNNKPQQRADSIS